MSPDVQILTMTALSVGFVHTILGPDHYIPFVAMSKASDWSITRTLSVTTACGVGHLAGSVVLGFIGLAFGTILAQLEAIETLRGDFAAWLLIAFGLIYLTVGLMRVHRNPPALACREC